MFLLMKVNLSKLRLTRTEEIMFCVCYKGIMKRSVRSR
jgi:hypothetical protein